MIGPERKAGGVDVTLIVHELEKRSYRRWLRGTKPAAPLVVALLHELQRRGSARRIRVASASDQRRSDAAILHVTATVVPPEYLEFAAGFERCVNAAVADISKRTLDSSVNSGWDGPVIVKSNLNARGYQEANLDRRARDRGTSEPFGGMTHLSEYRVYDRLGEVPPDLRDDPRLAVQRFAPERDEGSYAIRHWVFCGTQGYCKRFISNEPIIKGSNVIRADQVSVPDSVRRLRQERGFDYGKFDFVVHEDQVLVFDVNRTPGEIPPSTGDATKRIEMLADGLEELLVSGGH
jgi:hypothetical protein